MSPPTASTSAWVSVLLALFISPPAYAALTADHIAILANGNSPDSLAVAEHYAVRRGVPKSHIIRLDLPTEESISRRQYEELVIHPVRHALVNRHLADTIRVLITTYGVPLKIEAALPSNEQKRWLKEAQERKREAEGYLERVDDELARIAAAHGAKDAGQQDQPAGGEDASLQSPESRFTASVRAAIRRLKQVQDRKQIEQWTIDLTRITAQAGGTATLVQNTRPAPGADRVQAEAQLDLARRQIAEAQQVIDALTEHPSDKNRERAYKLSQNVFGWLGTLRLAVKEEAIYSLKDSDSSLDSELSLLWWDMDFYPLTQRLRNPLYYAGRAPEDPPTPLVPVLMVSRLDASSPEVSKRLVDQAIEAEQGGVNGKVYLDARGLKPAPAFQYGYYDQSIRELASAIKGQTSYEVILEDTERRFSRAGEAQDVAIYVGWYKLRSYEDAFTFKPGAIGYHIASAEAVSLHNQGETGWCKNALDHGIAVTIGSTGEPYVDAFPVPSEFITLLLTGKYSLVEAYYLTVPHVSWRMVLIGDPLYTPWKDKGLLVGRQITLVGTPGSRPGTPAPPSLGIFRDPIETAHTYRAQRQALIDKADLLLAQMHRSAGPAKPPVQ